MAVRPAVEAEGLVRTFGDVMAVDGIDLSVSSGEVFGFLGPNGAGKSTVVRMLTTLLRPTAGTATVGGHDVVSGSAAVPTTVGVASQHAAFDALVTGRLYPVYPCACPPLLILSISLSPSQKTTPHTLP